MKCFLFKKHAKISNLAKLLISIIGVQIVAFLGSLFTMSSVSTWYATLPKPSFNPPSWVFGPVWTILFLMMAVAAYLIWKKGWKHREVRVALYVFIGQLALNLLWSVLFFGLHSPLAALYEIIILWLAILLTILVFYKISKPAAYLLIPYILWVTFAAVLNFAIWNISFRIENDAMFYIPANSSIQVLAPPSVVNVR